MKHSAVAHAAVSDEGQASTSHNEPSSIGSDENVFGNFAHLVITNEGNAENASFATHEIDPEWILDSGASKHVAGNILEFESYNEHPPTHKYTIQTADGTAQPIQGVGTVKCT